MSTSARLGTAWQNRRILITGGLGFIGSNLAIRLAGLGARVTIVDSAVAGCGANHYNLAPVKDIVRLIEADLQDAAGFASAIRESDVIFNLAGEISHIHSMDFPERDAQLNAVAQLRFLQECVDQAPGVRIVYASTRQIYGVPEYLPVDELHPIRPVDFNGIHNYSAHMYHLLWSESGALDAVALCLTNVYGPRMALNVPCQGVLSHFVRLATLRRPLSVFGDGRQLRDPLFVEDAVDAFLVAGAANRPASRTYNVGGPEALPLARIAAIAAQSVDGPAPQYRPFPEELKAIDIGSYYTDGSRIRRELGWTPMVTFAEGIGKTIEYYRTELPHYLDPRDPRPVCPLPQPARLRRVPAAV